MAAALTLSYTQLAPAVQWVFRQLGVFVAGFTTGLAVAAVDASDAGTIETTLHLLLRRNLVMYHAEQERWQLHDLVRDLAHQYLDAANERTPVMWRYAQAAVQLAQSIQEQYLAGGTGALVALAHFDAERPHIDAALHWAAAHAEQPAGDLLLLAGAAATAHIGYLRYDARRERIPQGQRALAAARRQGDQRAEGLALNNLGAAYADLGEAQRAIAHYDQRLHLARTIGDQRGEGIALNNLGLAYAQLGEPRRAIPYFEQRLQLALSLGDRRGQGSALGNLGDAAIQLGQPTQAIAYIEQTIEIFRAVGNRHIEGRALDNLASAYALLGQAQRACAFFEQALAIARAVGDRHGEGDTLQNLAQIYLDLGEIRRAVAAGEQALEIARAVGARRLEGYALGGLACAQAAQGQGNQAATTFAQATALLSEVGDRWGVAMCQWQAGLTLHQQGDRQPALVLLRAALAYWQEIGHAQANAHAERLARLEADPSEAPAGQRAPS